ncbi:MAG: hypothetical protein ACI9Y1_000906 [Lentisphaeria bacterium]|jgi:hypothetical protein
MRASSISSSAELISPVRSTSGPAPSVAADFHPSALADIYQPEINIAIWQRSLASDLHSYAEQLVHVAPHWQTRFIERPALVSDQLANTLPLPNGRQALIDDVVLLVDMFSCLFELEHVGVRMAVLRKAMCPKFHVDRIPCRLLCTYAGPGTFWHSSEQVDYLGNNTVSPKAGAMQKQLSLGDVALLKGEYWEGNEGHGLVHRSPLASDVSPRLVLTLDFS